MRPIAQTQSALRMPLNNMLATEANVRVLRVLGDVRAPISAPELARRAQLQRSSVHRTLKALEELGIVEYVGTVPHAQVALRDQSPLAKPIRRLFAAEQLRYDELLAGLKRAADELERPPLAVWLEGRVARGDDRPGDPVLVSVVDRGRLLPKTTDALRKAVRRLERKMDVQIEVRGRTVADLEAMPAKDGETLLGAVALLGVPPGGLLQSHGRRAKTPNIRVHADHDARARAVARGIADAIKNDPTVVEQARRYIATRWRDASPGERKELAEWKQILKTASPARLRKILTDPGERATRLRQTLPFLGIASTDRPR